MTPGSQPGSTSPIAQILGLAATMSAHQALVVYLDEWLGAILRPIPGLIRAGLQWAYCRLAFARLDGFCFIGRGARITHS